MHLLTTLGASAIEYFVQINKKYLNMKPVNIQYQSLRNQVGLTMDNYGPISAFTSFTEKCARGDDLSKEI